MSGGGWAAGVILRLFKSAFDALDRQVSRFSDSAATLLLTALFCSVAAAVHFLIRLVEGQPIRAGSVLNFIVEMSLLAGPAIFYARDVIGKLRRARAQQNELSRRLAIAVDEAQDANRAKSAFLANMSHELRTPLNAILGFSEIMKDQHLGPVNNARYLSYARDIHVSGRHLLGIINDILDLAKIESGKMSLESANEFDLAEAVTGALAMVAGLAEKYDVRIVADLPQDGVRLVAVERMIRQIVINLVGNAIKFTPEGGSVTLEGGATPDGGYALVVRDTGIGMTDKEIANALVPFGQNENKMSAKHDGTGLGLPLAKAMLELHGGSLAIASRPQHGTIVTLRFPAERRAKPRVAAA